jgi:non-ribosomal peptide synthetase component F
MSTSFLSYASLHSITPFQLGLASFYAFLLKLTHGESDLCIACINANRYRNELLDMIGMFVSTLPYRIQLDPHWSFDELVKHVRENCLSILSHSHYPLQHILADFHVNQSNVSFLETVFDFITVSSDIDELSLNGINLKPVTLEESSGIVKFDFMLTFIYNPSLDDGKLSCHFAWSCDLFDETTVNKIAQRFQHLFEELFVPQSSINQMDECIPSIWKLSIIYEKKLKKYKK